MSMQRLGSILSNYSPQSPFRKSVTSAMVVEMADTMLEGMFGPEVGGFAVAAIFKDGILTIRVTSGSASGAIQARAKELLTKLNTAIGSNLVRSLKFSV